MDDERELNGIRVSVQRVRDVVSTIALHRASEFCCRAGMAPIGQTASGPGIRPVTT
jgi:hypothetical protein